MSSSWFPIQICMIMGFQSNRIITIYVHPGWLQWLFQYRFKTYEGLAQHGFSKQLFVEHFNGTFVSQGR